MFGCTTLGKHSWCLSPSPDLYLCWVNQRQTWWHCVNSKPVLGFLGSKHQFLWQTNNQGLGETLRKPHWGATCELLGHSLAGCSPLQCSVTGEGWHFPPTFLTEQWEITLCFLKKLLKQAETKSRGRTRLNPTTITLNSLQWHFSMGRKVRTLPWCLEKERLPRNQPGSAVPARSVLPSPWGGHRKRKHPH